MKPFNKRFVVTKKKKKKSLVLYFSGFFLQCAALPETGRRRDHIRQTWLGFSGCGNSRPRAGCTAVVMAQICRTLTRSCVSSDPQYKEEPNRQIVSATCWDKYYLDVPAGVFGPFNEDLPRDRYTYPSTAPTPDSCWMSIKVGRGRNTTIHARTNALHALYGHLSPLVDVMNQYARENKKDEVGCEKKKKEKNVDNHRHHHHHLGMEEDIPRRLLTAGQGETVGHVLKWPARTKSSLFKNLTIKG